MSYQNFRKQGQKGFTLIELMVVIAIIGALSGLVLVSLTEARKKADDTKRVADMQQIRNAIEIYAVKHKGEYPPFAAIPEPEKFAENTKKAPVLSERRSIISYVLSFVTPSANAAVVHTEPACLAFDALANQLKIDGDISSIPVDPQDAPTLTCYKAYKDTVKGYVAVYTYTWQKYLTNPPSNKKVGFIVSKNSEINVAVVNSVCAGTSALYGGSDTIGIYPVLNPTNSSTLCTSGTNLAADTILGVTAGDATGGTSSGGGGGSANGSTCASNGDCLSGNCNGGYCSAYASGQGNGSACTYNADCSSGNCVTGVCQAITSGSCSDSAYTDQTNCEANGSCSNTSYTNNSACIDTNNGYCSNSTHTTQASCVGNGTCSNTSYLDESSCTSNGTCSGGGHTNQGSCEGDGFCSGGGHTNQGSCEGGGSCSGGGYGDPTSCTDAGYCDVGGYGNPGDCAANSGNWTSYGYSWSSYSWTPYNYTWNPYTWGAYLWSTNTWTPNVWTP